MYLREKVKNWLTNIPSLSPISITLIYVLVGSGWVLISDQVINNYVTKRTNLMLLQLAKDSVHIISTAIILFMLIRLLQRQIQASEANYRLLINRLPDGVAIVRQSQVVFCNTALLHLLDIKHSDEIINHSLLDFVPHEQREKIKLVLNSNHKQLNIIPLQRNDNRQVLVEITQIPVQTYKVQEYQLVLHDVTAYKRLEAERRAAYEHLEERVRERTYEIRQQQRIAESLGDILAIHNSKRSLDSTLEFITRQAKILLNNDADAIFQLDVDKNIFEIKSARGLPAEYVENIAIPTNSVLALSEAVRCNRPIYKADISDYLVSLENEPLLRQRIKKLSDNFRAVLAVPLVIKDDTYGGLVLYYHEPQKFSNQQVKLAKAFGDQVSLAIENARLQTQIKKEATSLERNRIARDLHDAVTQTLFSASLISEVLPDIWQIDPAQGRERLKEIRDLTRSASAEMRNLLLELRPTALIDIPMSDLITQLAEGVKGRARKPVIIRTDVVGKITLPIDVKLVFYRVLQEALHNAVKHAKATELQISIRQELTEDRNVVLHVSDNGRGFDPKKISSSHLGLKIMRERAESIGAQLLIETEPEQGTCISLAY